MSLKMLALGLLRCTLSVWSFGTRLCTRVCQPQRGGDGTPCLIQHSPGTPTTGLRERGNNTSGSTGRSGRQNASTRRNMRREERVTVQGPVKEQQPDGMSHGGMVKHGPE